MYRWIVAGIVRDAFRRLGDGDVDALVARMVPGVVHHFPGDHALGGSRHSRDAVRRWLSRLVTVLPGLRFDVLAIVVGGWPWRTTVAVEWIDHAVLADGSPYRLEGAHVIRMRWGRVVAFRAHTDGGRVAEALRRQAASGVTEAAADPIRD